MSNIIKSFSFKDSKLDVIKKFEDIAEKEGKKFSELLVEQIEDYTKKHGDGNPGFTLDQFADPNFKVCPAFFRDKKTWKSYLEKLNKKEREEFLAQCHIINQAQKEVNL